MYIYKITNKINQKIYIGQTWRTIKARFAQHKCSKSNMHLYNAFNKYGKDNFSIELFGQCYDQETADFIESALIEFYNSTNRNIGYNIREGGDNSKRSSESKLRMSNAQSNKQIENENLFIIRKLPFDIIKQIIENQDKEYNLSKEIVDLIVHNEWRYCCGCRNNKTIDNFNKCGNKKCKDCIIAIRKYQISKKNKKRRKIYYNKNKEKIKVKSQTYRDNLKNKRLFMRNKILI